MTDEAKHQPAWDAATGGRTVTHPDTLNQSNSAGIVGRLRDYSVRERPLRDEAADTIEGLLEALRNARENMYRLHTEGMGFKPKQADGLIKATGIDAEIAKATQ